MLRLKLCKNLPLNALNGTKKATEYLSSLKTYTPGML